MKYLYLIIFFIIPFLYENKSNDDTNYWAANHTNRKLFFQSMMPYFYELRGDIKNIKTDINTIRQGKKKIKSNGSYYEFDKNKKLIIQAWTIDSLPTEYTYYHDFKNEQPKNIMKFDKEGNFVSNKIFCYDENNILSYTQSNHVKSEKPYYNYIKKENSKDTLIYHLEKNIIQKYIDGTLIREDRPNDNYYTTFFYKEENLYKTEAYYYNGELYETKSYSPEMNITSHYIMYYPSNDKKLEQNHELKYDEKNRLIEYTSSEKTNGMQGYRSKKTFQYENNRFKSIKTYTSLVGMRLSSDAQYRYNDRGYLIEMEIISDNPYTAKLHKFSQHDQHGNWTVKEHYLNSGELQSRETRHFEYWN